MFLARLKEGTVALPHCSLRKGTLALGMLTLQHHGSCRERHGSTKQDQPGLQEIC